MQDKEGGYSKYVNDVPRKQKEKNYAGTTFSMYKTQSTREKVYGA